ncbi:MAG: hypothetical protein ACI87W_002300 [Halieaceae bacterium]|jgi:hypothetical protein
MQALATETIQSVPPFPQTLGETEAPEVGYTLLCTRQGSTLYERACRLSAREYQRHFNCVLKDFYPAYFCLLKDKRLMAVCGLRSGEEELFLEQYLDQPLEHMVSERLAEVVARESIVEIGGFALRNKDVAMLFMASMAPAFWKLGYTHAVCTATLPVRRCLRSLGIHSTSLAKADPARLRAADTDWGNYYAMRPAVVCGSLASTLELINALAEGQFPS